VTNESDSFRLDEIQTRWSLVGRAHDGGTWVSSAARGELAERYRPAIRAYLGGILRDDESADDLTQEVMVRVLRGDFAVADASRGRFRDLLKTAIRNMARTRFTKERRRSGAPIDGIEPEDPGIDLDEELDRSWVTRWREEILAIAWRGLEAHDREHAGSSSYLVLRSRVEHPDASSDDLARIVSERTGRPLRADAVRQALRRARARFAELVIDEVARGLAEPSPEAVKEELREIGLHDYLRDFLRGS
jgi:RNA polymerase sigma factor (sigma-70 family)